MAAERVMGVVTDVIKEQVLAAVGGELAARKDEVDELRQKLTVLEERYEATATAVEERERELAVVKGELGEHQQSTTLQLEEAERRRVAEMREMRGQVEEREREVVAVKRELAEHKDAVAERWDVAERKMDSALKELREEARKGEGEMRAELARETEERRRVVQEFSRGKKACAFEELATCRNVELEISQSEGDQKIAWEQIKAASRRTHLDLECLHGLSDAMLAHVSTMTQPTSINLESSSGLTAEGMKHLYRLPWLEKLDLIGADVTDNAMEGIGSMTRLKQLYLDRTKVTILDWHT